MSVLSGILSSFPLMEAASHSNQEYLLLLLPLRDSLITSKALDFSLTATMSPGRMLHEGILHTCPFTVMCL